MTARFKNQARKNIKENTKNLKGEINGLDEEIAQLQDHLLGGSTSCMLQSHYN